MMKVIRLRARVPFSPSRRSRSICTAAFCLASVLLSDGKSAAAAGPDALLAEFQDPPNVARPQVWWHWMSGNVSLEGAKLDLEWMKRVGIGGVHTFSGGGMGEPHVVEPPVNFMSEQWKDVFRQTTEIARKAGMEVTIAGSPGWSETGGTWVEPRNAMKKYVWSETSIEGGRPYRGTLVQPPGTVGPFMAVQSVRRGAPPKELLADLYQDSVVIAFPTSAAEAAVGAPRYTSSAGPLDLAAIASPDMGHSVELPIAEGATGAWLQAAFDRPTTLAALTIGLGTSANVTIEASDDGIHFRTLMMAAADPAETPCPEQTYAFAPSTARMFRVSLSLPAPKAPLPDLPPALSKPAPRPSAFSVKRLAFSGGARVERFESKAGFQSTIDPAAGSTPTAAANAVIPTTSVIDVTQHMRPDGQLLWTPPRGRWTVVRFGWSLTGQTNGPAEPTDTGLEVDKLDPQLVREYLESYLELYRSAMGRPLDASNVQNLLTDSWEAGVQNWTATLLSQFKERRGYDATPYLPVLTGRVVEDSATSDRFIADFYRTLKELLADNHQGVLAKVLHEHGLGYYAEAQGDTPRAIGDGMTMKARSDMPTAEFWYRPFATGPGQPSLKADLAEAASAAHVYGKPLAAAEALTVAAGIDPWSFSPAMMKPVVDEIFAHGINRILLHESHHQPLVDKAPGLTMFIFGQYFNRNDTWAEQAAPWVSYLSRTSYLLQRGRFVADIAYFYGEERNLTELFGKNFQTGIPQGYPYDFINPEALLSLLSVEEGRLVTASGMSYRILYLPSTVTRFTLPAISKIRDLVAAGAVLVGSRPIGGLGMQSSDEAVQAIADVLWGTAAPGEAAHRVGKGRVYADLTAALAAEKIQPDVSVSGAPAGDQVMSVHRQEPDSDIYFLSNRQMTEERIAVNFRVHGMVPQLWHAEDGSVQPASYSMAGEGVTVQLHLDPEEALFVVFRHSASEPESNPPKDVRQVLTTLNGSWAVKFQSGRGAPAGMTFDRLTDWTESADPRIKYFSGEAQYSKTITAPKRWMRAGRHFTLDLGSVHELASVSIDGKLIGSVWHPPYQLDLARALTPGTHRLDIQVVNLWPNRLIGDKQPGAKPVTFAPQSPYESDSPLLRSGLLGPVRIIAHDGN